MNERQANDGHSMAASNRPADNAAADLHAELLEARAALADAESRHAAESERAARFRDELQHRVRNMLAMIRSIFARSIAAGGTIEDLADHFPARLDVVARYQLSRMHEPGGSVDLEEMVRDELQRFHAGTDPRIFIAGPDARLGSGAAPVLGLALHEMATNSIKFGVLASADAGAELRIQWRIEGDRLLFRWEEGGVPILVAAPLRVGFGRQFIEQALPYQLGAEASFELRPGGFCALISLPFSMRAGAIVID